MEPQHLNEVVLAEGEVTGHAHRLRGAGITWDQDEMRLVTDAPATLTHEEHGRQTLPAKSYTVGIVREVDHLREVVRNVVD